MIDLFMMYAVHDAFRRDLAAFNAGREPGRGFAIQWARFQTFLHVHHTAEDEVLWPLLRARLVDRPQELALLDDMEREHNVIDPLLSKINDVVPHEDQIRSLLKELAQSVSEHLEHEEADVLPLASSILTQRDWDAFGKAQRRSLGSRSAATFLPWVLDGASDERQQKILALLPPPVRLLCRRVWQPRYELAQRAG